MVLGVQQATLVLSSRRSFLGLLQLSLLLSLGAVVLTTAKARDRYVEPPIATKQIQSGGPSDDLIIASPAPECPSATELDCDTGLSPDNADVLIYPTSNKISAAALSTPRQRGTVTPRPGQPAGSKQIGAGPGAGDIDSSGSEAPCSPDDEDCDSDSITYASGDAVEGAAGGEEKRGDAEAGGVVDSGEGEGGLGEKGEVMTGGTREEETDKRTTFDDIVYVIRSTDVTTTQKSSPRSRTKTTTPVTTLPVRDRVSTTSDRDSRTIKPEAITTPSTTRDLIIITVNMTESIPLRRRPQTVPTITVGHTSPHEGNRVKGHNSTFNQIEGGLKNPQDFQTHDSVSSREQMARLTLNIGLIVGVAGGLALLLLVIACALYKYKAGAAGRGGVKAGSPPSAPCMKGYVYESCNMNPPSSPTPLSGVPGGHFRTLPPSAGSYHYPGGQTDSTTCATTGRRRDVKEWYV